MTFDGVHCALGRGADHATDAIEHLRKARVDLTLETNVYRYVHMAETAVPHLKRGAAIINIDSVPGLEDSAALLDASATKGAIHVFTKALASQLPPRGIRVDVVAPGPVWTPLNPAKRSKRYMAGLGATPT